MCHAVTGSYPRVINGTISSLRFWLSAAGTEKLVLEGDIWGLMRQVSQVDINNYIPQFIVGCNYLSLPEMPASGTNVLIWMTLSICLSDCPSVSVTPCWCHDMECFRHYWPFVKSIHSRPVDSHHKGSVIWGFDILLFLFSLEWKFLHFDKQFTGCQKKSFASMLGIVYL